MKFFLNIVVLIVFVASAVAQDVGSEISIESSLNQIQTSESGSNYTLIKQVGEANNVQILQQSLESNLNKIITCQDGVQNYGYIKQSGSGHASGIKQSGTKNEANIWAEGNLTLTIVSQDGEGNTLNSYIDNQGIVPKAALVVQNGNNNTVELALIGNNGIGSSSWPKDAVITQNGNNHELSAKLESYNSPIIIEQQAGIGGEGMKVNISNSDFYFPTK